MATKQCWSVSQLIYKGLVEVDKFKKSCDVLLCDINRLSKLLKLLQIVINLEFF